MRLVYVSTVFYPPSKVSSFNIFNERLNSLPLLFFSPPPVRAVPWITSEKSRENVSREKKKKKERKKQFFARFPSFSFADTVRYIVIIVIIVICHNPGIGEILCVREFDGRKRCKKRGKKTDDS